MTAFEASEFATKVIFYERCVAATKADPNPDNTLFMQLTQDDAAVITACFWAGSLLWGDAWVDPTREKFIEVMEAQGFHFRPTGGGYGTQSDDQ